MTSRRRTKGCDTILEYHVTCGLWVKENGKQIDSDSGEWTDAGGCHCQLIIKRRGGFYIPPRSCSLLQIWSQLCLQTSMNWERQQEEEDTDEVRHEALYPNHRLSLFPPPSSFVASVRAMWRDVSSLSVIFCDVLAFLLTEKAGGTDSLISLPPPVKRIDKIYIFSWGNFFFHILFSSLLYPIPTVCTVCTICTLSVQHRLRRNFVLHAIFNCYQHFFYLFSVLHRSMSQDFFNLVSLSFLCCVLFPYSIVSSTADSPTLWKRKFFFLFIPSEES